MSESVPSAFTDATILTPNGDPVRVGELCASRTIVFALVRQFG